MAATPTAVHVFIVGASGNVGSRATASLLQYPNVCVSILVRKASQSKPRITALLSKGARLVDGDVSASQEELTSLIRESGAQVLLSTISGAQSEQGQLALLAASKTAGVRWFIPSQFGPDGDRLQAAGATRVLPFLEHTLKVQYAVQQSGLDWTLFNTGGFTESVLSPFMGIDHTSQMFTAPGSFSNSLTITCLDDIGRIVADVIVNGRSRNDKVWTGEEVTWEQMFQQLETATGRPYVRVVRSISEYEAAIEANPFDIGARFGLNFAKQLGVSHPSGTVTYAQQYGLRTKTLADWVEDNIKPKKDDSTH